MNFLQISLFALTLAIYLLYVVEAFRASKQSGLSVLLFPPYGLFFAYIKSQHSPYTALALMTSFAASLTTATLGYL